VTSRFLLSTREIEMIRYGVIALLILTVPAMAGDEPELTGADFMMPSRNVACLKLDPENGLSDRLYCLRYEPELISVELSEAGVNWGPAEGDQPGFEDAPMLKYGDNWYHEGFSCDSDQNGVVCSHGKYGAFQLSRKGVEVLK
jgi:hypothetical protein